MKKTILLVVLTTFSLFSFAQDNSNNEQWSISIGVNAINNLSANPLYKPGKWDFTNPLSAAVEYSWMPNFALEQSIAVNSFSGNSRTNGVIHEKQYNYISFDTHAKYYFKEIIFGRGSYMSWFDVYANAGLGYFHIEEDNLSASVGGGLLFWLNSKQTIGLRAQALAKLGLSNSLSTYDNHHYQYNLQATFKL